MLHTHSDIQASIRQTVHCFARGLGGKSLVWKLISCLITRHLERIVSVSCMMLLCSVIACDGIVCVGQSIVHLLAVIIDIWPINCTPNKTLTIDGHRPNTGSHWHTKNFTDTSTYSAAWEIGNRFEKIKINRKLRNINWLDLASVHRHLFFY